MVWRLALILSIILFLGVGAKSAPAPGEKIAPFSLTRIGSGHLNWEPGKTTVITFCAFWCDTWKEQSKRLNTAKQALNGLPVEFLTISVDGRWSEECIGKITGEVGLDKGKLLSTKLRINRIPYTIVVDSSGSVRYASQGIVRCAELIKSIRECVSPEQDNNSGTIYLTFDDFPSIADTSINPGASIDERLIKILKDNNIQATFFCVCNRLGLLKDICKKAEIDGNSLQIHSWDHNNDQINRCKAETKQFLITPPTLYRPAGSDKCFYLNGRQMEMQVVNPYDYLRPGKEELKRRILLAAKPGSVILLHAGVSETLETLPEIIKSLKNRGFGFDVLR